MKKPNTSDSILDPYVLFFQGDILETEQSTHVIQVNKYLFFCSEAALWYLFVCLSLNFIFIAALFVDISKLIFIKFGGYKYYNNFLKIERKKNTNFLNENEESFMRR